MRAARGAIKPTAASLPAALSSSIGVALAWYVRSPAIQLARDWHGWINGWVSMVRGPSYCCAQRVIDPFHQMARAMVKSADHRDPPWRSASVGAERGGSLRPRRNGQQANRERVSPRA